MIARFWAGRRHGMGKYHPGCQFPYHPLSLLDLDADTACLDVVGKARLRAFVPLPCLPCFRACASDGMPEGFPSLRMIHERCVVMSDDSRFRHRQKRRWRFIKGTLIAAPLPHGYNCALWYFSAAELYGFWKIVALPHETLYPPCPHTC